MLRKYRQQKIARREFRHKLKRKYGNLFRNGTFSRTIMKRMAKEARGEKRIVLKRMLRGTMATSVMG